MNAKPALQPPFCSLSDFDSLITEATACERYPLLLGERELLNARRRGEIAWVGGKKGAVLYHPDDLARYLSSKAHGVAACPEGYGNTADTGSPKLTEPAVSTLSGMTKPSEILVADHLAQKYSSKPKKS